MRDRLNRGKGISWYLCIFLLAVLLYVMVMIVENAYPFGEKCFLADDAYVQYNTMLRILIEYIHSGYKTTIMWNHGMGTDIYLTALYYLVSPFNLIALVMGEHYVEQALTIIIVLKCSLVPVTGLYYFRHTTIFQREFSLENDSRRFNNWISFCCAFAWGFCGYIIAYGQNIIWLDALMLMPLIALSVEKIRSRKGYWQYILLLAMSFIFNFYYAFYICMFIVVYYFLLESKGAKIFIKGGLKIVVLSLVSVLMAGAVLIPAVLCIIRAGDTILDNTDALDMWGDLGHYIVSFFPFKEITNGYLYNNNNYCGTIAVMMLFLFLFSSSVAVKEKIKYGCISFLFMLAANFLPLNYVFHGFVVPHGTGNRFAIILTFVMLIITCRMLFNLSKERLRTVAAMGFVSIVVFALAFTDNSRLQVMYSYIVFLFVMVLYIIVLVLLMRKSITVRTAILMITVVWVFEICGNAVCTMKDKASDKNMVDDIRLEEWCAEYDLLRTDGENRKTSLVNYDYTPKSNINWYSSMINGYFVNAFSYMGFLHFDNVECVYDGATPLTAMMYNVRYVLTNAMNTNGGYHAIYSNDEYSIYEADELAGWGFMTDDSIKKWKSDRTVAENQSEFIKQGFGTELSSLADENMDGIADGKLMEVIPWGNIGHDVAERCGIFSRYTKKDGTGVTESYNAGEFQKIGVGDYIYTGKSTQYHACVLLNFVADKDMELYVYSEDNRDQAVMIFVGGKQVADVKYTSSGQLVYGGHVEKGQKVKISVIGGASVGETAEKRIRLYSFNTDLFERVKPYITDETLISDGYEGNTFKGHITVKEDGVLYMAFPYSDGYTIYVDGKKAEKLLLGKGNMGVELTGGDHEIMLEYHTPGLVIGIVVSGVGLILFVLICIYDSRRKKSGME